MLIAAVGVLSVAVAARPRFWTRHPAVPALALVASAAVFTFGRATVDGVHGVSAWWTVLAQVLGQLALAGCAGWASGTAGPDRAARRGLAMAGGMLVFVLLLFAYYSAYDLGVPNRWVPITAAACVAVLGWAGTGADARDEAAGGGLDLRVPAAAVVAALLVAAVPLWRDSGPRWRPVDDGLRIAAYNVRMGYGMNGTMTVTRQAAALRALRPHVVVLGEVDRAWLLNGGRDQLRLIADRLGMRAVWAPMRRRGLGRRASHRPARHVRPQPAPGEGRAHRGAGPGSRPPQGRPRHHGHRHAHAAPGGLEEPRAGGAARGHRARRRAGGRPVVLTGDLNLQPGDRAWEVLLGAGLTDAMASVRPALTFPALPKSTKQLDHVLVTPDLVPSDPAIPDVPHSDHRPIAVTLAPRS